MLSKLEKGNVTIEGRVYDTFDAGIKIYGRKIMIVVNSQKTEV